MSLLETIKRAGIGAVEAGYPVAILFGTVSNKSPLEVNVDQRFILSEDFFIVPEDVRKKVLEPGDTLLLLRVQGGQSYIILDRV